MFDELKKRILENEELSVQDFSDVLAVDFPWLLDLKKTEQDEQWHAEGNVHIHTDMVLTELYKLIEAETLTADEVLALVLSALLHDIAKPRTTKVIERNGRSCLICPNHEEQGRNYVLLRLLDIGAPAPMAKTVADLVGYHQMPKRLLMRDMGLAGFALLQRQVDLKLLYYLELADMRGRECVDRDEQVEWMEFFKEEVIRLNLWQGKPYTSWVNKLDEEFSTEGEDFCRVALAKVIRDFEVGKIHSVEEGIARTYSLKQGYPELILLCGLSGSGKSTWVKSLVDDYEIISLDEIREELTGKESNQKKNAQVVQLAKERLKVALAKKRKVVYDATNLRKDLRQKLLQLAENYGAYTEIIFFAKPLKQSKKSNRSRERQVGDGILTHQLDRLQLPEVQESHRLRYVDKNNEVIYDSLDL